MEKLTTITRHLDKTLRIDAFEDSSHNGLQVESSGKIAKVCCGVDASMAFFKAAKKQGADLLVCHHGLSWGDSLKRITGQNYQRLSFLIENDMALYACHLPLDAHSLYGNNIRICRALGLQNVRKFARYKGMSIGYRGSLPKAMSYADFKKRVRSKVGSKLQCMDFGKNRIRSVGVVSGGAAYELTQAAEAGLDVYLSGEPALAAYHDAQEYGINAIFAGHYATETFGVKALATMLSRKYKLKASFIDLKIPF